MAHVEMRYPQLYPVFFVGTSLGGVEALQCLARALPQDFPAPIFFLLHRRRNSDQSPSLLHKVLQRDAAMGVIVPNAGDVIQAGNIYLPQDGYHLAVDNDRIALLEEPTDQMWRPSIDVLFKSGARDYKDRAVCVLLTGNLEDGVEGLKETTYQGGVTVAQSPEDAFAPYMPLNALLKDHPCYVLPLAEMPKLFSELAGYTLAQDQREITEKAAVAASKAINNNQ